MIVFQACVLVRVGPSPNLPIDWKEDYVKADSIWSDRTPDSQILVQFGLGPGLTCDPYSVKSKESVSVTKAYDVLTVSTTNNARECLTLSDIVCHCLTFLDLRHQQLLFRSDAGGGGSQIGQWFDGW